MASEPPTHHHHSFLANGFFFKSEKKRILKSGQKKRDFIYLSVYVCCFNVLLKVKVNFDCVRL